MVNKALQFKNEGISVIVAAFLDKCLKNNCPMINYPQFPEYPNIHLSHGTMNCRTYALDSGLEVIDTFNPDQILIN